MNRLAPDGHRAALDRLEAAIEALSEAGDFDVASVANELASIVDRRATAERLRHQLAVNAMRPRAIRPRRI
jgi:hypothetical protein